MKLTLGYVRVSSLEQEQGFGREVQIEKIQQYCERKELGNPEIFCESKSGESTINRNELHQLLGRAEIAVEAEVEVNIVFYGLDRLTRDLIDQEAIVQRCMSKGIRLHSTLESENDTLDPAYAGDPMRTAIRQFFGILNQLDRAIIKRRLDSGLARKAAQGGFTGGRPPFGYRVLEHDLVIDEQAAPAVNRIFQLAEVGIDQRTIAVALAREYPGICGHWKAAQIGRALKRRELYEQGIYRPRGSDLAIQRPELIILQDRFRRRIRATDSMDFAQLPDPVRLCGLAVLLQVDEEDLKQLISRERILVRWRGNSPLVPKASAIKIYDIIKRGQK